MGKCNQLGRSGGGALFYCEIWHLCPSTTAAVQKSQWEMTCMNICFHIWKCAQYPDFFIPYLHVEILALETIFLLHQFTMARQLAAGLAISVVFLTRKGSVFCLFAYMFCITGFAYCIYVVAIVSIPGTMKL